MDSDARGDQRIRVIGLAGGYRALSMQVRTGSHPGTGLRARWLVLLIAVAEALAGCSSPRRANWTIARLEAERPAYSAQVQRENADSISKLIRRLKREHDDFTGG